MKLIISVLSILVAVLVVLSSEVGSSRADGHKAIELQLIRQEANDGNPGSQLLLGLAYLEGRHSLLPDVKQAVYWLSKSANAGNSYAMLTMGKLYASGQGVEKSPRKAIEWWRRSAELDNPEAEYLLGKSILDGFGGEKNPSLAIAWLKKSAAQGNRDAQFELGKAFHEGKFVPRDLQAARSWLQRAAEQTHTEAINLLSVIERLLESTAPVYQQSLEVLEKKARQGDPDAELELGLRYQSGAWDVNRNPSKALLWVTRSAESGNTTAIKTLIDVYQHGKLDQPVDLEKARFWQSRLRQSNSATFPTDK